MWCKSKIFLDNYTNYTILILRNYHININHNLVTHKLLAVNLIYIRISKYLENIFALGYIIITVCCHSKKENLIKLYGKLLKNIYNF